MAKKGKINQSILLSVFLICLVVLTIFIIQQKPALISPGNPIIQAQKQIPSSIFTYNGQSGKDALTLLRQKATIELNKSGMVSVINGRKADAGKHEYWAFYVDNKLSQTGPAEYQTHDTDMIKWKIETY